MHCCALLCSPSLGWSVVLHKGTWVLPSVEPSRLWPWSESLLGRLLSCSKVKPWRPWPFSFNLCCFSGVMGIAGTDPQLRFRAPAGISPIWSTSRQGLDVSAYLLRVLSRGQTLSKQFLDNQPGKFLPIQPHLGSSWIILAGLVTGILPEHVCPGCQFHQCRWHSLKSTLVFPNQAGPVSVQEAYFFDISLNLLWRDEKKKRETWDRTVAWQTSNKQNKRWPAKESQLCTCRSEAGSVPRTPHAGSWHLNGMDIFELHIIAHGLRLRDRLSQERSCSAIPCLEHHESKQSQSSANIWQVLIFDVPFCIAPP